MNKLVWTFLIGVIPLVAASAATAADVGVSVAVTQPGFYGRLDLGNVRQPEVIYAKPVVVAPAAVRPSVTYVQPAPIYLRVPPGHIKHWQKHCAKYNACNVPVYFVREHWFQQVYLPYVREHRHHARHGGHRRGHG